MDVEPDVIESTAMVVAQPSVETLIVKAIEHNVSVEALERLLAMRERLKAEQAREAFFEALSAFQADCPIVPKRKTASAGAYTYRYAALEDIVATVTPLLRAHGLSYRFDTRFEDDPPAQVVRCIIHHRDGHSEESGFRTPVDAGARMNDMQKAASAQTYAKRYAFCNALGILTGDDDNDGHTGGSSGGVIHSVGSGTAGGGRAGGVGGVKREDPSAVGMPQPVAGRNVVRVARQSGAEAGDSQPEGSAFGNSAGSQPAQPAHTPTDEQAANDRNELVRECVDYAGLIEIDEREQRGQEVPPIDVLLPIAGGRCDAWLSKSGVTGTTIHTASMLELEGLRRVLRRRVDEIDSRKRQGVDAAWRDGRESA